AQWVTTEALDAPDLLPTLQAVNTDAQAPVRLHVVEAGVVQTVMRSLENFQRRDPKMAQVVLWFVGTHQLGVEEVALTTTDPPARAIAYGQWSTWSDQVPSTDGSGLAFLANVNPEELQGRRPSLEYTQGKLSHRVAFAVQAGAITLLEVQVE
ncbi:hypothetical protein ACFL5O_05685, partial [Myxococcota bacterium]